MKAKRFYKDVTVGHGDAGHTILLDGRTVKTPASRPLAAPTQALAEAIANEWRAQKEEIVPDAMPLTKALNTALDRIGPRRQAVIDDLAQYANSDLLCYRAEHPADLVRRQAEAWDPWLAWADKRFGATLNVVKGVTHTSQPADALSRLRAAVAAHDDAHLVALHTAITITGSAVLGLAFAEGALSADDAFAAARVDERYQIEHWGSDAEAEKAAANRLGELRAAERFLKLARPPSN